MDTKPIGRLINQPGLDRTSESQKPKDVLNRDLNSPPESSLGKGSFDVQLSQQARDAADTRNRALEIALNSPDIREDRVAEIKDKIRNGTYKIDAEKVADGIFREAIMDKLATMSDE